ncbi:hypothetical protein HZA56_11535 [Candidatus Poribacteria bacterium]|nr:hypothetical protein [Candidatus Poribacteria bacterium]
MMNGKEKDRNERETPDSDVILPDSDVILSEAKNLNPKSKTKSRHLSPADQSVQHYGGTHP